MSTSSASVTVVPLVPNANLPRLASARTRASVPAGYGVQEHCLPFTAASALGVLIPSPIRFGLCALEELPEGCRAFRPPSDSVPVDGRFADVRVFYVFDNPDCRFIGNAWQFMGVSATGSPSSSVREPGVSFFDRNDQRNMFKLHLPYVWRTPDSVDTLFLPLINRKPHNLEVQCGLVETDWYASPVNLVMGKPPGSIHVNAGDPIAQAIFVPRELRRPTIAIAPDHARISRETREGLAEWDRQHAENRSAYKVLARSRQGRLETEAASPSSLEARGVAEDSK